MRASGPLSEGEHTAVWLTLLLLAVAVYAFGLGGQYIPTNGDEMVYAHIARETAQTGQWLPLASELVDTRNTKPPLLFWQAMTAGAWGAHWQLWVLRVPSLIYTLLLAGAAAWTVRLITGRTREAMLAACIYLAFYSTFHYGRPYLTSAPETFWFSLPMFWLLWLRLRPATPKTKLSQPGWVQHIFFGLALGLGLAYKSFALIAPAAAAWWLALVLSPPSLHWPRLLSTTFKVGLSAALALGVFALWFVLDPDPRSVWQEFIVDENARKFSDARGYWHEALAGGGSSMWAQLLAYPFNAGLLALPVIGLAWQGWKRRRQLLDLQALPPHLPILLAWAAVWLIVFTLPSQRSARYVIPAMPAVAILLALYWRELARRWFVPTLLLAALALLGLARLAWVAHALELSSPGEWALSMLITGLALAVMLAGLMRRTWLRSCALALTLLVYAAFDLTVAPLDGPVGRYEQAAALSLRHARIAVPNSFNGQFERFQFLLPGRHQFLPYDTEARAMARVAPGSSLPAPAQQLERLLSTHDAVVWVQTSQAETAPSCLPGCTVLDTRWLLKSRHLPGEIRVDNLWYPQQWLFRREWLLSRAGQR